MQSTRILEAYAHDGSWRKVYTAFVLPPPAKPATPLLSRTSGTWNARIDRTSVSWGAVSGATGYVLDFMDGNLNIIQQFYYGASTTTSGNISITPGRNTYNFRLYAYASNDAGTTFSNASNTIRVISGSSNNPFTITHPFSSDFGRNWLFSQTSNSTDTSCNIGSTYSITRTGNSSDPNVAGYVDVQRVQYGLEYYGFDVYSLASSSRSLQFSSPGYAFNYPTSATVPKYEDFAVSGAGGGTYSLTASGTGWSSRESNCTLRVFNGTQTSIRGAYFRIRGVETIANAS
jgi:hypothetical protein